MRKLFVAKNEWNANDYLWAAKIVAVEGGFMVFESLDDAATWENQK